MQANLQIMLQIGGWPLLVNLMVSIVMGVLLSLQAFAVGKIENASPKDIKRKVRNDLEGVLYAFTYTTCQYVACGVPVSACCLLFM